MAEERRRHPELFSKEADEQAGRTHGFRSRITFLGLPLFDIRFSEGGGAKVEAARGWIAIGNLAYGGLVAIGGLAVAPVAFGGVSVGLISIGGGSLGLFAMGGMAVGAVAIGGLATGLVAVGGMALAWAAASGGLAIAHDLALGSQAVAVHANDAAARLFFEQYPWLNGRSPALRTLISACWIPGVLAAFVIYWQNRRLLRFRR